MKITVLASQTTNRKKKKRLTTKLLSIAEIIRKTLLRTVFGVFSIPCVCSVTGKNSIRERTILKRLLVGDAPGRPFGILWRPKIATVCAAGYVRYRINSVCTETAVEPSRFT